MNAFTILEKTNLFMLTFHFRNIKFFSPFFYLYIFNLPFS